MSGKYQGILEFQMKFRFSNKKKKREILKMARAVYCLGHAELFGQLPNSSVWKKTEGFGAPCLLSCLLFLDGEMSL